MVGRIESLWSRSKRKNHKQGFRGRLSKWRRLFHMTLAAGLFVQAGGCTRNYFRQDADKEVSEVLAEKDKYPNWQIDNWHIYADPRARFADNTDPDHPPKPPDDPASYDMAPNPQRAGKPGIEPHRGERLPRVDGQMGQGEPRAPRETRSRSKRAGERTTRRRRLSPRAPAPFLADKPASAVEPADPSGMGGVAPHDVIVESKAALGHRHYRPACLFADSRSGGRAGDVQQSRISGSEGKSLSFRPACDLRPVLVRGPVLRRPGSRPRLHRRRHARRPDQQLEFEQRHGLQQGIAHRRPAVAEFQQPDGIQFLEPQEPHQRHHVELQRDTTVAARRRRGGGARIADAGRAQLVVRHSQLRPLPQRALRRNRQPKRRQHQRLGISTDRGALQRGRRRQRLDHFRTGAGNFRRRRQPPSAERFSRPSRPAPFRCPRPSRRRRRATSTPCCKRSRSTSTRKISMS